VVSTTDINSTVDLWQTQTPVQYDARKLLSIVHTKAAAVWPTLALMEYQAKLS
jgi:hypothetical protein